MKKTILRSLSIFLAIFFLLAAIPIGVSAAEITSDFEYSILDDGTIELTRYKGGNSDVALPEEIDGKIVTKVNEFCFYNDSDYNGLNYTVKCIFISKNIDNLSDTNNNEEWRCLNRIVHLEAINVDEENPKYSSDAGILFNKDLSKLIYYPTSKLGEEYKIPGYVKELGRSAFSEPQYLKRLKFCSSFDVVNYAAIFGVNIEEADYPIYPKPSSEIHLFSFCERLNKVYISKEVNWMNNEDFLASPNVTLYVYDNSYGLKWAQSHNFPYVIIDETPIKKDIVDSETGIKVNGIMHPDATLNVKSVENTLDDSVKTFDITILENANIIQPSGEITISIPCEYSDCKVFWVKDDGTKVDMNAEYVDGKYVFKTDHLSVYSLVRDSKPTDPIPEITEFTDSATGISVSGQINADSMKVEKVDNVSIDGCKEAYEISFEGLKGDVLGELDFKFPVTNDSLSVCHISPDGKITEIPGTYNNGKLTFKFDDTGTFVLYEKDSNIMGDVNLDGKTNINDVTLIQKWIAKVVEMNEVQKINADFNEDGVINIKDATAIQKWIAS